MTRLTTAWEASPPTTTISHGSEAGVTRVNVNIDANMVVILAVLLCALLCALGLNSVVRCALRCCTGRHHHNRQEAGALRGADYAGVVSRGLKRSTIRQIPTTNYHIATGGVTAGNNNVIMSTDCIICLGEFMEGEKIKVLPKCKHGFHSKCIDTWLLSHSTCPTCRQSLSEWAGNGAIVVSMGSENHTVSSDSEAGGRDAAQRL